MEKKGVVQCAQVYVPNWGITNVSTLNYNNTMLYRHHPPLHLCYLFHAP